MAIDTLTPFPVPPLLGQDQATFNTNASNTLSGMQGFINEQNVSIGQMNTTFDSINATSTQVASDALIASGSANFQGDWTALTSYIVGQSVYYNSSFYNQEL